MTKKQLLKKLEKVENDAIIVLASDSEGNSFSELDNISAEKGLKWDAENREIIDEDDNKDEYYKLDSCIILWP